LESSINVVLEDIEEQNITIKVINSLCPGFLTNRLERKTSYLIYFKSLKEEELRMKEVRVEEGQTCPHCKKTGHTEEKCWLKSQARDALARIGSMTAGVRRTFIG